MKSKSLLCVTSLILSQSMFAWTANPLKWGNPITWVKNNVMNRMQSEKKDTQVPNPYQCELEHSIAKIEKRHASMMNQLVNLPTNIQGEDPVKILEHLQERVISHVVHISNEAPAIIKAKNEAEIFTKQFPCLAYSKQLSDDVLHLEKKIKRYKKHTDAKQLDQNLLASANILILNLKAITELLVQSKTFADECTEFTDQIYKNNKEQLPDITAQTETKPNTSITASIS